MSRALKLDPNITENRVYISGKDDINKSYLVFKYNVRKSNKAQVSLFSKHKSRFCLKPLQSNYSLWVSSNISISGKLGRKAEPHELELSV